MTTAVQTTFRAVKYRRVSSRGQLNGYGFDRQDEIMDAFIAQKGIEVIWPEADRDAFEDAWTGTDTERAGFAEALEFCTVNGIKHLICESADRFARDSMVFNILLGRLLERGISLWSAVTGDNLTEKWQSDPMSRFFVQLQGLLAELDKNLTVKKLRMGRAAAKKRNGRCEGQTPYGKRPEEVPCLRRMLELSASGKTPTQVADILNVEGFRTRKQTPWNRGSVWRIVQRHV